MNCEYCGSHCQASDKFCVNCGADLIHTYIESNNQEISNVDTQPKMMPDIDADTRRWSSAAIVGFVLSLIGMIWSGLVAVVCAVLGLVFSSVGISRTEHNNLKGKGMATAGLVISTIGLVFEIIYVIALFI